MKRPKRRVWVEELAAGDHPIPPEDANYLFNVLRLQNDDVVELFDGSGRVANATLSATQRLFHVEEIETHCRVGRGIELYQSMPKGDRWEWIIEKSGELGVERLIPIVTEHSVVKVPPDKIPAKLERWQKIASGAARQSTSTYTTHVCPPISFAEAMKMEGGPILFGDFEGRPISSAVEDVDFQNQDSPCRLFVGPEGGFSTPELELLRKRGVGICLGPRVLRAETAAVALIVLAQATFGDWS